LSKGRKGVGAFAFTAAALAALMTVFAVGNYDADAHTTVHPQKKLFTGRWYKPSVDLTASPPWFGVPGFADAQCDGGVNTAQCVSEWQGPAYGAYTDWNNQNSTARFHVQVYQDHNNDNNVYIIDNDPFAPPGLLGIALFYDHNAQECVPFTGSSTPYCSVYRWADALIIDDNHTSVFGTAESRRVTITHELGHVLSLRHESVNANESLRYACGQDDTGAIPHSVMSYDCITPPGYPPDPGFGEYNVQPWDVCGVNHAYPDPVYEWEECVCYGPPGGPPPGAGAPAYYHPVAPARILDTRDGTGGFTGRLGHNCYRDVQVTGVGGVPATGVTAVVLNVTITSPSKFSYLTAYPTNAGLPTASNLNFLAGQSVPNLVTVKVGADGKVRIFNANGQTHVIFDVVGWYGDTPDGPPTLPTPTPLPDPAGYGYYHPIPPDRILDTRSGVQGIQGKLGPGGTTDVLVTNIGGVPTHPSGVTAVVLNVTVTDPTANSYLTVYPKGPSPPPTASNLNFGAGQTVPNLVIVKVGDEGRVTVFNCCGFTHVIFDVVGWYGPVGTDGTLFRSLAPARILDTRIGLGWPSQLGHNGTAFVDVTGVGGVPDGAKGVIVNATVTGGTANSYLTVYPSDASQPLASNLNFLAGQTVPNLVMVKVPPNGIVNVYNCCGQVHAIFDVVGYFE